MTTFSNTLLHLFGRFVYNVFRFWPGLNTPLYTKLHFALFIIVISGYCSLEIHAQSTLRSGIDSIYESDIQVEQKIQQVQQFLRAQDTLFYTAELGYAYHRLGLLYNKSGAYEQAITQTLKAMRVRSSAANVDEKDLNNSLFNIYVYFRKMDSALEGVPYLDEILKNTSRDKFYYRAISSLAGLKAEKGDYYEAITLLDQLFRSIDKEQFESIFIAAHKRCIEIYSRMPAPEKYIQNVMEHEKQLESYALDAAELLYVNNNLGIIYSRLGKSEQSLACYLKVLSAYELEADSVFSGQLLNNLGVAYSKLGKLEEARFYYNQALGYADFKTRADIYDNQGFYFESAEPRQQLHLFQKAIRTVLKSKEEPDDVYTLPTWAQIEESPYRLDVLFFLLDKATAWVSLFEKEKKVEYLIQAKETLRLVDQLVSTVRLDTENDRSKLFWINRGVDTYVLAAKVCFLLNEPAEAFYFMEKSKSLLLLENIERTSQVKTRFLSIISLEEALETHVSAHSNLLEFILNEEEGFGLICTEKGIRFYELNDVPKLIIAIGQLKEMVRQPFTTKEEFETFDTLSNRVFTNLLPFPEAKNLLQGKRLTIVTDYELHNLPFELLITEKNKESFKKNYLLHTAQISYLNSCSVARQINEQASTLGNGMIGFAPTVFPNDTLPALRLSENEMKDIASFFPSRLALREQASLALFIESLDKYDVIHVNSHAGYTQNSTPWLSLYDQRIDLEALSSYSNHSNLVILDACKSALGEQELGEGMMSLARAFFYGGSASVIASQWQVNEKSSGEIFKTFYKELKAGAPKYQALHQAKLSYLESNQLGQLSPYYWASFTLTGDAGPLPVNDRHYWMFMLVPAVLIFLFLTIYRKRTKVSLKDGY